MITYAHSAKINEWVYLDLKCIGEIKQVEGGFAYFPKKSKTSGETFQTIRQVKKSLEEE